MNKYIVVFTKEASESRGMLQEMVTGYSEEDALLRSKIPRSEVSSITEKGETTKEPERRRRYDNDNGWRMGD